MVRLKSNKSLSFTEILITVSILSVLIIFIFRALNTCLAAARFGQNISAACLLAESKLWEAELKAGDTPGDFTESGIENINAREFFWSSAVENIEDSQLLKLNFKATWNENVRNDEHSLDLFTYLFKESTTP